MKRWVKGLVGGAVAAGVVLVLAQFDYGPHEEYVEDPVQPELAKDTMPDPPSAYGIRMNGLVEEEIRLKSGTTFGSLLSTHGVSPQEIDSLVRLAAPLFDVTSMRAGHPAAYFFTDDAAHTLRYFVYKVDQVEHVVFGVDTPSFRLNMRPVVREEHTIACTVSGALWNDIAATGADPQLAMILADIYAWTVDFYRIQKGDKFTVVYRENKVDGERYGAPEVLAARYESGTGVKEAFRYTAAAATPAWYDAQGNSLKKAFLKAPLKFSRISSGYTLRRFHPVQKRFKAHLGTDYAAPYGTPILAVGDGTVEKAGYTSGNGNYVKIRHNGTYETQYLHMRKILVRQGQRVSQGQTIGEVGSTGLATGPHVCFRFWKNGEQVDPRREEMPKAEPLPQAEMERFATVRDPLLAKMNAPTQVVVALR